MGVIITLSTRNERENMKTIYFRILCDYGYWYLETEKPYTFLSFKLSKFNVSQIGWPWVMFEIAKV